ncbi:MAG: 2-dehydropantoate 2-reductase [Planctomycetes bacterium]|nr:2-dehydropantoate 2-reductase [Planctomycetota bacterium]
MNSDSILILGTGALATLFAARLAAAGVFVTMLGTWPEGLAALSEKGVRVDGDDRAFHVHATDNPAECKGMRFALVLVKAWQTERAAHQLSDCLAEDGVALTLQNGLGNDTVLALTLGLLRVARGVTTLGATLLAPGLVCLGGDGTVSLESHPRLSPLEEMIHRAGFVVNVVSDLQSLVWGKLAVSSAINPLTALLRVKNGELLERPSARALMGELARETAGVAKTLGVALPFPGPELAAEDVAQRTAENQSSMLQDVLRGAPTEIDAINGAVVRLAEEKNLQVPVNRTVWSLVKAIPVRGKITGYCVNI